MIHTIHTLNKLTYALFLLFCVTESAECAVQGCSCNNGGYTATQAQFATQHMTSPAGSYSNCTAYNYKYITSWRFLPGNTRLSNMQCRLSVDCKEL